MEICRITVQIAYVNLLDFYTEKKKLILHYRTCVGWHDLHEDLFWKINFMACGLSATVRPISNLRFCHAPLSLLVNLMVIYLCVV